MKANQPQKENVWRNVQDRLAEENGLAIVLTDKDSPELSKSNNNSMCALLYNSEKFAPRCAQFCGKAFEWANEAKKTVEYKCHAGLNCLAVPLNNDRKPLVAIVGRAFLSAEDYRKATERAVAGDWQMFSSSEFFENILLSPSKLYLETIADRLETLSDEEKTLLKRFVRESENEATESKSENTIADLGNGGLDESATGAGSKELETPEREIRLETKRFKPGSGAWRSFLTSLINQSYKQACASILQFVENRYAFSDLAWLESGENAFDTTAATGKLKENSVHISLAPEDKRLLDAVHGETPLELRRLRRGAEDGELPQSIYLFPIAVGESVQSAIIVGDENIADKIKFQFARFCRRIAPQLEILRLREEIMQRGLLARAIHKFNDLLKNIDTEDFWASLVEISAEMMRSERSSLLISNEKSNAFIAKAAIGDRADFIMNEKTTLGERVAGRVLQSGEPLVVENVEKTVISKAPAEWDYKSNSFISYPIIIGERKIGVLNLTERAGGEAFSRTDLELLDAFMPQIALLIDRAGLQHKAGEFEQLSVTDALTGLLNRRYLEERLAEEIKRSNRHGFPMSFMMIDVDDFKAYNDSFTHPEGDRALQIVGNCLRETLRGADVATRYGGEEFSILLPQTHIDEAETIAERIREKIEATDFPKRRVTVSIGIAGCSQIVCTPQKMIAAADEALYEAKRRGRNNVQVYEKLKEKVHN